MTPTPRLQARAFAIWRYANPRGWNVTYEEIADATGLKYQDVANAISKMGWAGRVNVSNARVMSGLKTRELYNSGRPDLTQIFRNASLTSAQEFGIDWS